MVHDVADARVHLHDAHAAIEITSPLDGVIRVRHAPQNAASSRAHPRLSQKQSVAVIAHDRQPLSVREAGDRLHVAGSGASLEVELRARGGWTFRDGGGALAVRALDVRGETKVGYPVPLYRSTLELETPLEEAWLGFGEKVGPIDKRGLRFTFWNTDVIPHHPDTDPLYASVPFALALRDGVAWGLFLDETWRSEVDVAHGDHARLRWEVWGPELDLYLISGPGPADVLRRYTALTGRTALPPLWSLGAHQSRWGYESERDILEVIDGYRDRGLPLDCVHLDIDYMRGFRSWTWDRSRFPDPAAVVKKAAQRGVKLVTIVDPALKKEPGNPLYDDAVANDLLVREDGGEILTGTVWPDPCVFPDFTRADVQSWWAQHHRAFLDHGIAGFWNDMNEPSCFELHVSDKDLTPPTVTRGLPGTVEGKTLPYDARHGDRRHLEVHNAYGLGMAKASHAGFTTHAPDRRPFILTRSGFAGVQRYAALWTGDNSSHWTHLEMSLPMLMGLGLSGVAFVGADIPGFLGAPTGELFVRWLQAGMFYPLMRNHSARGTPSKEPWRWGEPWLSIARAVLEQRYRLLPTLYTLMHECAQTGLPPMRALSLHHPDDREALRASDQFLFGEDLLVAPIVRAGQSKRLVYLPRGSWLGVRDLEPHGVRHEGGQHVIADAPLTAIPMWLREGGGLALTEPALHTTSAWWPTLDWHLHVGDRVSASLYEDAGDGAGEFRHTRLSGRFIEDTGGERRFVLERQLDGKGTVPRQVERVFLHGFRGEVIAVQGAQRHSQSGEAVMLEVSPDSARVELRLRAPAE